jgi:Ca2+-dependent lipid-binding protein
MQKNDLLKYWLLPLENLQAGTKYHNSIPGDSTKLMPLDETLNMYIHSSARYHVTITAHLAKENKTKQEKCPTRTSALCTQFPATHPLLEE